MDDNVAIRVSNIGKAYQIYDKPSRRLQQVFSKRKLSTDFWALKDISFSIPKGSVVGIVGRNGSGKSTLLQILAGTLKPTEGSFSVNGKVAALLELGSGFNPEFTGRENVFLSGSIYGIKEADMKERFEKIQEFADIGEFIDRPVKTYSSGMFARLAFAVNINVNADILIIDEVLSVGDHFFQAKCMEAIHALVRSGTTILLVSHSQATVKSICDSAILFNKGRLIKQGSCDDVLDEYMSLCLSEERDYQRNKAALERQETDNDSSGQAENVPQSGMMPQYLKRITGHFGTEKMRFVEAMIYQNDKETVIIENRKDCCISAWVEVCEDILCNSEIGIVIRTFEGIDLFALNSYFKEKPIPPVKKGTVFRVDFTFPVMLGPGKYSVTLGIRTPIQGEYADKTFNAIIFDVVDSTSHTIPLLFEVPFEIRTTI